MGSSSTDEGDDFDRVAGGEGAAGVEGAGDDFAVDLDGDGPAPVAQRLQQARDGRAVWDVARLAVHGDPHGSLSSRALPIRAIIARRLGPIKPQAKPPGKSLRAAGNRVTYWGGTGSIRWKSVQGQILR